MTTCHVKRISPGPELKKPAIICPNTKSWNYCTTWHPSSFITDQVDIDLYLDLDRFYPDPNRSKSPDVDSLFLVWSRSGQVLVGLRKLSALNPVSRHLDLFLIVRHPVRKSHFWCMVVWHGRLGGNISIFQGGGGSCYRSLFSTVSALLLVFFSSENPKEFLTNELEELRKARECEGPAPCLFDATNIRSVFGMLDTTGRGYITLEQYKEGNAYHPPLPRLAPNQSSAPQLLTHPALFGVHVGFLGRERL